MNEKEKINAKLMKFIDKTPNAYSCVENLKKMLISNKYVELFENKEWNDLKDNGKYFVIRNDSSIIAFQMTSKQEEIGFNITSVHNDSPSFSLKTKPQILENGYLKLNVDPYGGMINYTWFDRPLSLAGRVTLATDDNTYIKKIINMDKDLLIIPSQAMHINRDVNDKATFNPQVDMLPIMSLNYELTLGQIFGEELKSNYEICDYDLYVYNRDKAKYCGLHNEFIIAPRLDDLASLYPAAESFIAAKNRDSINVFCAFNNEEIGSLKVQGADSSFLMDTLTRVSKAAQIDLLSALSNTLVVSADNAHAIHPNAGSKSDPTNKVYLNRGVVIKHHKNYTTDGLSSSIFKGMCNMAGAAYQDYACKADMLCGTTLGGLSTRHVSVDSVDIGVPQLAMHSANETIGSEDILHMYRALLEFYQSSIRKEDGKVKVLQQ